MTISSRSTRKNSAQLLSEKLLHFKPDKRRIVLFDGVRQDVAPSTFEVNKLRLISFLKDKEPSINRNEMRKRAVELGGNLGFGDAERLLAEQQNISTHFRDFIIPFPGTLWRDSEGYLRVACLYWNKVMACWFMDFYWLDRGAGWGNGFCLAGK